jgi:hypothetical protein
MKAHRKKVERTIRRLKVTASSTIWILHHKKKSDDNRRALAAHGRLKPARQTSL